MVGASGRMTWSQTEPPKTRSRFLLGLLAAIASSFFIGTSLVIQKKALGRMKSSKSRKMRKAPWNCLCDPLWLAGALMMGVGECLNFVAYAFAPASLVAPLGALSVLVSAVLSAKFLKEQLHLLGWCGCFACITGAIVLVIHAPKNVPHVNIQELVACFESTGFILFCLFTLSCIVVMVFIGPTYESRNMLIYISICSLFGGYTVPACKGLAIAFEQGMYEGEPGATSVAMVCIIALIICCSAQLFYLNKALSIFDASIVTPIYYAFFTAAVVLSTDILFHELVSMEAIDMVGSVCGFFNVIMGTSLMQVFRASPITIESVKQLIRRKKTTGDSDQEVRLL